MRPIPVVSVVAPERMTFNYIFLSSFKALAGRNVIRETAAASIFPFMTPSRQTFPLKFFRVNDQNVLALNTEWVKSSGSRRQVIINSVLSPFVVLPSCNIPSTAASSSDAEIKNCTKQI